MCPKLCKINYCLRNTDASHGKQEFHAHQSLLYLILTFCLAHGKKTPLDMAIKLLGPSQEVEECIRFKEMKEKYPLQKSFADSYDRSFTKLQILVSKKYHSLKDEVATNTTKENRESLSASLKMAEKLLDQWGIYYF